MNSSVRAGSAARIAGVRRSSRGVGARSRSILTVLFLGGTVLLVILLALQAHAAWIYQRTTAEGVLRDYSRLVAEEFIRRASQDIGYRGFYCIVTAMQQHEELVPQSGGDGCLAPDLARTRFLVDPA